MSSASNSTKVRRGMLPSLLYICMYFVSLCWCPVAVIGWLRPKRLVGCALQLLMCSCQVVHAMARYSVS